jgi:hypothetical protein
MNRYTRRQEEVAPADDMRGHYRLVYRIIQQALVEAQQGNLYERCNAQAFIVSKDFDNWCSWVNIDPVFIRSRVMGEIQWNIPTS